MENVLISEYAGLLIRASFTNQFVMDIMDLSEFMGTRFFIYKKEVYKKVYIKSQKFKKVFIYNSGKF